jgi:hypothetical protein
MHSPSHARTETWLAKRRIEMMSIFMIESPWLAVLPEVGGLAGLFEM